MTDRTFEYLLNQMEHAAQQEKPADHDYAGKRRAVFAYVDATERLAEGRADLCTAYRLGGDHRRADRALTKIERQNERLAELRARVGGSST